MSLSVNKITVQFDGRKKALDEVNLKFNQGFNFIVGPTLSGKSTLLSVISLLLKPNSGEVLWQEKCVIRTVNDFLSKIGFVPQTVDFKLDFKALDLLLYLGRIAGLHKTDLNMQIQKSSELLDLKDILPIKMKELHESERKTVLICAALLHNPQVLLLDDLSVFGWAAKKNLLLKLKETSVRTFVIAESTGQMLDEFCDECILLLDGKVEFQGDSARFLKEQHYKAYTENLDRLDYMRIKGQHYILDAQENGDKLQIAFASDRTDKALYLRDLTLSEAVESFLFYKELQVI